MASRSKRKKSRAAQNAGRPVIVYNSEFIQPLTDEARALVEAHEYAQGYDKASASADELRELREENKRLKNEDYRDAHRFLGFHRMNFG